MAKDRLDIAKDLAQIASLLAVPILVAWFGWWVQSSLKESEIRRDYVQMAMTILSSQGADPDVRTWAVEVLQQNSPVPLNYGAVNRLANGQSQLLSSSIVKEITERVDKMSDEEVREAARRWIRPDPAAPR